MPLKAGYSPEIIGKNIAMEVKRGTPHEQAIAIALNMARREYRKAHHVGPFPHHLKGAGKYYRENPVKSKKFVIWKWNKITGMWNYARDSELKSDALLWKSIFEKDDPEGIYRISKIKPDKKPEYYRNPISEKTAHKLRKEYKKPYKNEERWVKYHSEEWKELVEQGWATKYVDRDDAVMIYSGRKNNPISEKTAHKLRKAAPRTFEKMTDEEIKRAIKVKNPVRPLKKPYMKTKTRFFFVDEQINGKWKPLATFQNMHAAFDYAKAYGKTTINRVRVTDTQR